MTDEQFLSAENFTIQLPDFRNRFDKSAKAKKWNQPRDTNLN